MVLGKLREVSNRRVKWRGTVEI